ncbi:(deoxy)nucleoside triphosphate pyrophosphohydrolase [Proteiniclasticum sediminis]|nr:(deoxy)nucleoside triphosphate pyrophosphohydrolase [Proteiniclasticum sediminis]
MMKTIEVVAAILVHDGKILCMQRDAAKYDYIAYKYEFPGGKIERGETRSQALMRELREEMDLQLNIAEEQYFMSIDHTYPDFRIVMHSYLIPVETPTFTLKEHLSFCWLQPAALSQLDWAPADYPLVDQLMNMLIPGIS